MMHKLPPQDLEAEQSILGAILLDNNKLRDVRSIISPSDFYRSNHSKTFQTMIDLSKKEEPIDLITLNDSLKESGLLDEVGGSAYIALLADGVATAVNVEHYANIVKKKW